MISSRALLVSVLGVALIAGCSNSSARHDAADAGLDVVDVVDALGADVGLDAGPDGRADVALSDATNHDVTDAEPNADADPDADPDAPDFSALDPSLCPQATAEDFRGFDPTYTLARSGSFQEDKSFYLLTLFDTMPDARAAVMAEPAIAAVASQRAQGIADALDSCQAEDGVGCLGDAVKWSDADIATVGQALAQLGALAPLEALLRKSGTEIMHADGTDAELVAATWDDTIHGLNKGWDNYTAPLGYDQARAIVANGLEDAASEPFYRPFLSIVLAGMLAQGRDEAIRYEPMAEGQNAAVLAHLPDIDFSAYPFGAIMVPGLGPKDLDQPLSPGGQIRADQAAARFAAHLAPLIILSGGHVHPDRTPYSEAIEMKKYLMATYDIAEEHLVVDPQARHTTTNLRDVARLMYRYGIPVDQPVLITTDLFQTVYIASVGDNAAFGKRCLDELGYKPWRGVVQLDQVDDCWIPAAESMQERPSDLLDP